MKEDFYKLLYKNISFCQALGRVMLSASKLEVLLKQYLRIHGEDIPDKKTTLGNLIKHLRENDMLTNSGEIHLGQKNIQRNYLVHNLYASFINEIDYALLPVESLVPIDVEVYTEKARETSKNFEIYSEIVQDAIQKLRNKNNQEIEPLI